MKIWVVFFCLVSTAFAKPVDKIISIVNNEVITASELSAHIDLVKKQIASKNLTLPDDVTLRQQVLDKLIDTALQLQLAEKAGITVDDPEIEATIDKICAHNQMSREQLQQNLKTQKISFSEYSANIRKEIIVSKLQQRVLSQKVDVTDAQLKHYLQKFKADLKAHSQYHLATILIPLDESPTPDAVKQARTKAHAVLASLQSEQDFNAKATDLGWRPFVQVPTVFAKQISSLKPGEITGPIRADNGFHLVKLLGKRDNSPKHTTQLTKARHILIKINPMTSAKAAKKTLQDLRTQLINKKSDFATLAKTHSQDPGSQKQGGDLGWIRPGQTVPAFEQAMNKLKPNQISQPIKSQFGYHLIEVIERKHIDDTAEFQQQQIRNRLYQQKFAEAVQSWVRELRDKAHVDIDIG